MKKRAISIVLAACLCGTSLHADFWDSFSKGWGNSQMGQLDKFIDDGEGGANYFANVTSPYTGSEGTFGGSVEFKFDSTATEFGPWADFKLPSYKASCNGITLDGGFLDALDISDIAEQLGSASGALVYGLFIGLVNSLPSIEHVFSKIKEMIQWVQSALRNACNFGQQISKNKLGNKGFINNAFGLKTATDATTKLLNEEGDKFMKGVEDMLSGVSGNASGSDKEDNQKSATSNWEKLFEIWGHTALIAPEILQESKMKNGYLNVTLEEINGDTAAQFTYLMAVNLFGEEKIASNRAANFFQLGGVAVPKLMATGKLDKNVGHDNMLLKLISNESVDAKEGGPGTFEEAIVGGDANGAFQPVMSPSKLINVLMRGSKQGTIELRNMQVFYGMAKTQKKLYLMLLPWQTNKKVQKKWKGLLKESEDALNKCLKDNSYRQQGISSCNGQVPLAVPNASEYLDIISQVLAKAEGRKTPSGQRQAYRNQGQDLINILAKLNAYYLGKYFLEHIIHNVSEKKAASQGKTEKTERVNMIRNLEAYLAELESQLFASVGKTQAAKDVFQEVKKTFQMQRNENYGETRK